MIDHRQDGLPAQAPTVSAPRPFADRRIRNRREADRVAHRETVLLARSLDILASGDDAETRLAGVLRLLARTAGARRAAVVADGGERRAAVAVDPEEDPEEAAELAAWLDANAPRPRTHRAAAGVAPIALIVARRARATEEEPDTTPFEPIVVRADDPPAAPRPGTARPRHFAVLPIPAAGDVALGFEFARAADANRVGERLPPNLARHAAVALALVTSQLATERELATLRAREEERASFVSTVAHELRTPLTGLRGYLELILGGQVNDPNVERDFLERSRSIVGSMGDLVGDLLELSRLESGTLGLEIGPFSLAEACSQVAASLLPIAIDRRIRLTTSLPVRLRVARADRRRVEQIVTNLAANALKFTPPDGNVEIAARFDGLVAIVVVRDDGAGIPAEDRARIFERFHRMAGHERITGTGLGLPIARDLARQMTGDLDVASVPGAGSAFVLALPGPAEVPLDVVTAALTEAVVLEAQALEERAVRRAIDAGRDGGRNEPGRHAERPTRISGSGRLRALPTLRSEAPTRV
ncbi:MAG TPA: HAMP domain-containing sensor histidine kinase [Candidatus Limnocylindrales bacterium]|nr:HAMP domain-containing sensor histidine kinase [Candidatus Limnocylindrales bacterium]